MDHRLVSGIEQALGWDGSTSLGTGRQAVRQADMAAVGRHLNDGASIVLDSADTFDPTIQVACRALGWWSGELVSANLYLAVGDTAGFALHWDDHDVICVQLAGSKSWEVRGPSRPSPMYRDAERNLEPSSDVVWSGTMHAGDVMHIPRGWWHTATRVGAGDGFSLHITFGITRRTGVTWINYLSDLARGHELFRLDLGGPDSADGSTLAAALATPPARHMPFVTAFGPPTAVAAVTEFAPSVVADGGAVLVRAAGKKLTFAARAEESLRVLLSGHPVYLKDDNDLMTVAMHLIEEGLCEPLTGESLSAYTGLVPAANCLTALSNSA